MIHELPRPRTFFVDHCRATFFQRMAWWVRPLALTVVAAMIVAGVLFLISARHQRRAAEAMACAARLDAFYARRPLHSQMRVRGAHPCEEWRALREGQR